MAARLTLAAINHELTRKGYKTRLEKASGYFYFLGGEATDWLDRTIPVKKISDLSLDQWLAEFVRLKKVNAEILRGKLPSPPKSAKAR